MSKILKITMILVMSVFAVFITPQERAYAIGPILAAEGAFLGGAAVYVGAAIAIGGIASISGCESCQESIEAHAQRTWAGSTQLAKDGLQAMIDVSVAAGNGIVAMNADFASWMDSVIDDYAKSVSITDGNSANLSSAIYYQDSDSESVRGGGDGTTEFNIYANGYHVHSISVNPAYYITLYLVGGGQVNLTAKYASYSAYADSVRAMNSAATFQTTMAKYGLSVNYVNKAGHVAIQAGVSAVKETWTDMKDAGLVLPTENARAMYQGQPVTYNPDTDSYAGIDGIAVPRDGITFEYPKPHWKTKEDLVALGGAAAGLGAGLYVDGWTGTDTTTSTYDPVTDTTTTTTSTTGTTTNVTTGESATTTTITDATTTTGDTTGTNNPTAEGDTPKTQTGKANRWGKLVTTKFPFSLPWDLFFILSFMNADPVSPVFKIDERILKRENVEGIQIKFDIDLSFLDPYVPWFRRFLILGFAFFLVMNTRKLLGGAQ